MILSLCIATPLSIYANIIENSYLIVIASIISVLIGLIVCLLSILTSKEKDFDYIALAKENKILKLRQ